MARSAIFEGIYAALTANAMLVPGVLGPRTVTNQRLYRAFPQTQSLLTETEPQTAEGWLVIEEIPPGLQAAHSQVDTIWEVTDIDFHVFGTTFSLGDAVADVLDGFWHWSVEQQRALQYGDRIVLFARRVQSHDKYAEKVKTYEKVMRYRFTFVQETQVA